MQEKIRIQERARIKREALIQSALSEFNEMDYESVTTQSISKRAGVSVGTFYQNFENKDEVLIVIAKRRFDELFVNIQGTKNLFGEGQIEEAFYQLLKLVHHHNASHSGLHLVLEQRRLSNKSLQELFMEIEIRIKKTAVPELENMGFKSGEVVFHNLFAMIEGLVHHYVFDKQNQFDSDVVFRTAAEMLSSYLTK